MTVTSRARGPRKRRKGGPPPVAPAPQRRARDWEQTLRARGLSLVQVAALIGGASPAWVRCYVPGPLPRIVTEKRLIVTRVVTDEQVDPDWFADWVVRLLLTTD